jgi:hypothetical protein
MWESAIARCCKINRRCRTTSPKISQNCCVAPRLSPRPMTRNYPSQCPPDSGYCRKSGLIRTEIPILNGSKCTNEHFSGSFRQPDTDQSGGRGTSSGGSFRCLSGGCGRADACKRRQPGRCEGSETRTPAVLHQNSEEVVIVVGAGGDAGTGKKLERVVAAQRQGERGAEAPVALQILVSRAVDGR